jgi:aspartate-semialdehyde dehydrogenase
MPDRPRVAIVGASGAVGVELAAAWPSGLPLAELRLFASPRSAGRVVPFGDKTLVVEAIGEDSLDAFDIALFSAGSTASKAYARAPLRRAASSSTTARRFAWTHRCLSLCRR